MKEIYRLFNFRKSNSKKTQKTFLLFLFLTIYTSLCYSQSANIIAENDDFSNTVVNGLIGGTAGNVFTNDTLDGQTATSTTAIVTLLIDDNLAGVTADLDLGS